MKPDLSHKHSAHARLKMFVGVVLVALFGVATYADRADDFIQTEMKRHQIPGLSLAVLKHGKVLKAKGYGFANLELKVPATPETVYQLASITKSFTATAVMQLVEDGKLTLSDRITTRLPGLPKAWSGIT